MYLSVIFILTIVIPFLVMPKHIRIGILPPYRVVLLSMMGICTMAAVILMIASFSGQGVYAQLLEAAEIASDQMSSNPALVEAFGAGGISEAEMSKFLMQMYSKSFLLVPSGILFMGAITSYIAYIVDTLLTIIPFSLGYLSYSIPNVFFTTNLSQPFG